MEGARVKQWSNVEIFALGLLAHGAKTQYDLESKGRLSSGTAWSTLKKLLAAGLIASASKEGKRMLSVTKTGRQVVEENWTRLVTELPGDTESVLRAAWLALAMGRRDVAAGYLAAAAEKRRAAAEKADSLAERVFLQGRKGLLDTNVWLRALMDAHVRAAEAEGLYKLVVDLAPGRSGMPPKRKDALPAAYIEVENREPDFGRQRRRGQPKGGRRPRSR